MKMKMKFIVVVPEVHLQRYLVEAEDAESAENFVAENLGSDDFWDGDLEYHSTQGRERWQILEVESDE